MEKVIKELVSQWIQKAENDLKTAEFAACLKFDKTFEEINETVLLTEYAVELRYPDDFFMPPIEETKEAFNLALKVKAFVTKQLI